jgi:hypothetical protein
MQLRSRILLRLKMQLRSRILFRQRIQLRRMFLPRPDHQILRRLNSEKESHACTRTLIYRKDFNV